MTTTMAPANVTDRAYSRLPGGLGHDLMSARTAHFIAQSLPGCIARLIAGETSMPAPRG